MPPRMVGSPSNQPFVATGFEVGNRLGNRPVVRQSQIYRTNESGNAMKDLLGHGDLRWDTHQQQGVFAGQAVYDAASGTYSGQQQQQPPPQQQQHFQQPQYSQQQQHHQFGGGGSGNNAAPAMSDHRVRFSLPPADKSQPTCFGGPSSAVVFGGETADGGGGAPHSSAGAAFLSVPPSSFEPEYPRPGSSASCDGCGAVVTRYYHCVDCREETGLFDLCVRCCGAVYLAQGGGMRIDHPTHDYARHKMEHVFPRTPP